jgi:hypothetical protein
VSSKIWSTSRLNTRTIIVYFIYKWLAFKYFKLQHWYVCWWFYNTHFWEKYFRHTNKVQEDLNRIELWCKDNNMLINCNKTKSMTVGTKQLHILLDTYQKEHFRFVLVVFYLSYKTLFTLSIFRSIAIASRSISVFTPKKDRSQSV